MYSPKKWQTSKGISQNQSEQFSTFHAVAALYIENELLCRSVQKFKIPLISIGFTPHPGPLPPNCD